MTQERQLPEPRHRTAWVPWLVVAMLVLAVTVAVLATLLLTGRTGGDDAVSVAAATATPTASEDAATTTQAPDEDAEGSTPGGQSDSRSGSAGTSSASGADEPAGGTPSADDGSAEAGDDGSSDPVRSCDPSVVGRLLGGSVDGIPVSVVEMVCTPEAGGAAWLRLRPPPDPPLGDLDMYLVVEGSGWAVAAYGQALGCADAGLPVDACAGLLEAGAGFEGAYRAALRCDGDQMLPQIQAALGRGDVTLRRHECTSEGGPGALAVYVYPVETADGTAYVEERAYFALDDGWVLRAYGGRRCADAGLSASTCAVLDADLAHH